MLLTDKRIKDDSYLCWMLYPGGFDHDIKRVLRTHFNDDASDSYSIGMLALFVMGNYHDILDPCWDCSGPVDMVEQTDAFILGGKLAELGIEMGELSGGTMESIRELVEKISGEDYDEEEEW